GSEPDCNCCLSNKYTYMQLRSPEVTRVNFHLSYLGARDRDSNTLIDSPRNHQDHVRSTRLSFAKDLQLELEGGQGLPAWRAESEGIELDYRASPLRRGILFHD